MIIEAICVVAGAVPGVAWAVMERRHMAWWRAETGKTMALAQKAVAQRDSAEAELSGLRAYAGELCAENAKFRNNLVDCQPKPKAPPMRGKNGRFVAREVVA